MCLGQEDAVDLRAAVRSGPTDDRSARTPSTGHLLKPKGHDFIIDRNTKNPPLARHMSVTGG